MSGIDPAVSQVLLARDHAQRQQIDIALLAKGLDSQKQIGDSINALIEQTVDVQKQISAGYLDVKA
tara:strand:+ start:37796 stop:37993 length:198 start_codon:yes stop_codon:yes gene_type:complete